jgi:hypothetical protein
LRKVDIAHRCALIHKDSSEARTEVSVQNNTVERMRKLYRDTLNGKDRDKTFLRKCAYQQNTVLKNVIVWDEMPWSLVEIYRRVGAK